MSETSGAAAGDALAAAYLADVRERFRTYRQLGDGALAQLADAELFATLDADANSIAVIVKHLHGNLRSRFTDLLTADGEKPDRDRDGEFTLAPDTTAADVHRWWAEGWDCVTDAIDALAPADLMRTITIRHQPHLVLQALDRSLTHVAYHVGQIVLLARHARGDAWASLSIPRGGSQAHNAGMARRHGG